MTGRNDLLRGVCLLGLAVFLVLLGALVFLSYRSGLPLFTPLGYGRTSFSLALEAYDRELAENPGLSPRQRLSLLNVLEKKAVDTENSLSVLKRRRAAALHAPEGREQYRTSYGEVVERVRKQYSYSAQIGALAAEALVIFGERPLSGEAAAELRELAGLMNEGALQDLSLAFSVYSGSMGDPLQARQLPRELFFLLGSLAQGAEREKYRVNACIRTLLEGNSREAVVMAGSLFDETPILDDTIRFGAEFFYDHGNFLRSAELFSAFTDSRSLARQADAQWLAGFAESARGLWLIAASESPDRAKSSGRTESGGQEGTDPSAPGQTRARCYYNLASTAPDRVEAGRRLEQLFAVDAGNTPGRIFGIIRYSRLAPLDRALVILGETNYDEEGLFDLELLRRRSEAWTVDRTTAETWNLLNKHSGDGRLFEWAVWYFDFQRHYTETAVALRNAGINRTEGPWSALHRAFAQVREHNPDEAEKILRSILRSPREQSFAAPGRREQPLWQAAANLALLLEKRRDFEEALQYYEIAAGQLGTVLNRFTGPEQGIPAAGTLPEQRDASMVQVHIAGIFRSLGKTQESLRALDYALDLDPENLQARMEKRRLDAERGML